MIEIEEVLSSMRKCKQQTFAPEELIRLHKNTVRP